MRKITELLIDDTRLPLLFTLGAEMQIAERMGDLDALFSLFEGPESEAERAVREEIEKSMTPEQQAKRDARNRDKAVNLMDVLPFVIATLAQQGQRYAGDPATITEEWITLHARPADVEPMTLAMLKAITLGLTTRHTTTTDETDLVAEAVEKN